MPATDRLEIRTPEGVTFAYELADPAARMLALCIDKAILAVVLIAAQTALSFLAVFGGGAVVALMIVAAFVVSIGYGIFFEWRWSGQTPGKRILRLRVVDADGMRLELQQVVLRNLLRLVDGLPVFYLVGGVCAAVSRKAQRLGDLAGATVVVRQPPLREPDLSRIGGGKYNTLRRHPHIVARLRRAVPPAQADAALQALRRRDALDAEARVRVFREMAERFREAVAFPPGAVEGISDENFVRNVVDVLYRTTEAPERPAASEVAGEGDAA